MYAEDKKIVATVRSNGIAVLPGLLAEDELTEIRHQFDQAYLDTVQAISSWSNRLQEADRRAETHVPL